MIEVNIRDHKRRTMKECFEWAQAHSTARWDFATIGRPHLPTAISNDEKPGTEPGLAKPGEDYTAKLREASASRPINWGEWFDFMCKRGGSRNLAVYKQFVRIVAAFESEADAKAFRAWLRGKEVAA